MNTAARAIATVITLPVELAAFVICVIMHDMLNSSLLFDFKYQICYTTATIAPSQCLLTSAATAK